MELSKTVKMSSGIQYSFYQGQWERGMKWGQGKMTYASGNFYEGNWENNKRNGHGVMHWLSTNERYSGNWKDNF